MGGDEHRRNVQGQLRAFLREGWMLKAVADPQADLHPCKPACVEGKKRKRRKKGPGERGERREPERGHTTASMGFVFLNTTLPSSNRR